MLNKFCCGICNTELFADDFHINNVTEGDNLLEPSVDLIGECPDCGTGINAFIRKTDFVPLQH